MAGYINTAKNQDWGTPDKVMEIVSYAFNGMLDLDPCGNPDRLLEGVSSTFIKAASHKNKALLESKGAVFGKDGLLEKWYGNIYVNPPYGKPLDEWMRKCADQKGANVIALLPSYTGRAVFQETLPSAAAVCLMRGRLKFAGAKDSAGFSSMLVLWSKDRYLPDKFVDTMDRFNAGLTLRMPQRKP